MNTQIKSICIITLTNKGGVAKTLTVKTTCNWLDRLGVSWKAFDFDAANKGLVSAFPDQTKLISLEGAEKEGEFMRVFRRLEADHDVTVIDLQAHSSRICLETMVKIDFIRSAYARGIQVVGLLFPTADPQTLSQLNDDVAIIKEAGPIKLVAVENVRNVPGGNMNAGFAAWRGSAAGKYVAEFGATIKMPSIISVVDQSIVVANAKARRNGHNRELTLNELITPGNAHLPYEYQGVLQSDFVHPMWAQFARNADYFLPPALADQILAALPPEPEQKAPTTSSVFDCINPDGLDSY